MLQVPSAPTPKTLNILVPQVTHLLLTVMCAIFVPRDTTVLIPLLRLKSAPATLLLQDRQLKWHAPQALNVTRGWDPSESVLPPLTPPIWLENGLVCLAVGALNAKTAWRLNVMQDTMPHQAANFVSSVPKVITVIMQVWMHPLAVRQAPIKTMQDKLHV